MSHERGPDAIYQKLMGPARLFRFGAFFPLALLPLTYLTTDPLVSAILLCAFARLLLLTSHALKSRARVAKIGAQGESMVMEILSKLPQGWVVEKNVEFGARGDIDFLIHSPQGKVFLIDAKAHRGTVRFSGHRLIRNVDGKTCEFERDIVSSVKRQAAHIRNLRGLNFVCPIIVFTKAELDLRDAVLPIVKVLSVADLLPYLLLQAQSHRQSSFVASKAFINSDVRSIAAKQRGENQGENQGKNQGDNLGDAAANG